MVAGVGVEPTSGDYEPPEIPFLYPASVLRWVILTFEKKGVK